MGAGSFWEDEVKSISSNTTGYDDYVLQMVGRWADSTDMVKISADEYMYIDDSASYNYVDYIEVDEHYEVYRKQIGKDPVLVYTTTNMPTSDSLYTRLIKDPNTGKIWFIFETSANLMMTSTDNNGATWSAEVVVGNYDKDIAFFSSNHYYREQIIAVQDKLAYLVDTGSAGVYTIEVIDDTGSVIRTHSMPPVAAPPPFQANSDLFNQVKGLFPTDDGNLVLITSHYAASVPGVSNTVKMIISGTSGDISTAGISWDEREMKSITVDEATYGGVAIVSTYLNMQARFRSVRDGVILMKIIDTGASSNFTAKTVFSVTQNNIGESVLYDSSSSGIDICRNDAYLCGGEYYVFMHTDNDVHVFSSQIGSLSWKRNDELSNRLKLEFERDGMFMFQDNKVVLALDGGALVCRVLNSHWTLTGTYIEYNRQTFSIVK